MEERRIESSNTLRNASEFLREEETIDIKEFSDEFGGKKKEKQQKKIRKRKRTEQRKRTEKKRTKTKK